MWVSCNCRIKKIYQTFFLSIVDFPKKIGFWPDRRFPVTRFDMDFLLVQIVQKDLDSNSSLDQEDIGKYSFVLNGNFHGYFDSQEEALDYISDR